MAAVQYCTAPLRSVSEMRRLVAIGCNISDGDSWHSTNTSVMVQVSCWIENEVARKEMRLQIQAASLHCLPCSSSPS